MKITNRIFAIDAETPAINLKPNMPVIIATIKNVNVQPSTMIDKYF